MLALPCSSDFAGHRARAVFLPGTFTSPTCTLHLSPHTVLSCRCFTTLSYVAMSWDPLPGMPVYTRVSPAVAEALSTVPEMMLASLRCDLARTPVDLWPRPAANFLSARVDHRALAAVDAASSGTYVQWSSIAGAGRGLFAAREFAVAEVILPFFGQVVYHDMDDSFYANDSSAVGRKYGDKVLPGGLCSSARYWGKRSLQVRTSTCFWGSPVGGLDESDRLLSVVPPRYCAAGWANAPPHGTAHNAVFNQRFDLVETHEQLMQHNCLGIRVTRSIRVGEEVQVCYGEKYDHWET